MESLFVAVKIHNLSKIVVVPLRNIYKLNLAKTLNNRINRNQIHLMFWSSDHGKKPNFNASISNRFDSAIDSCYNVRLLKVFDNLNDAMKYKNNRRNIDPGVYNERRMCEKPLPLRPNMRKNRTKSTNRVVQPSVHNYALETPPNSPMNIVEEENRTGSMNSDEGGEEEESPIENTDADLSEEDNSIDNMDTDEAEENIGKDTNENGPVACDNSTEDVICLSDPSHIERHRPIREFDMISGSYKFLLTPKGDRVYTINEQRFKLKKETVDRLLYYNKSPTSKNNPKIDKTFVELLLLSAVGINNLKKEDFNSELIKIIKDFYKNRVGREKVRLRNFENYVTGKCQDLRMNN